MKFKEIFLAKDISVNRNYDAFSLNLKKKLDDNFFKGYFDKDESVLYYRSDFLTIKGFTKIPVTQIKLKKGTKPDEQTLIEFKIITPLLIVLMLLIIILWTIFFLNVGGLRKSENGLIVPVFGTAFFYGLLFMRYTIELSYFRDEIRRL